MQRLTVIALGGVLGSLARYAVPLGLGEQAYDAGPAAWPWATLSVNLVGALLIGLIAASAWVDSGPSWRGPFLITGVLGGFTTFSAFALETGGMLDSGRIGLAAVYVVVTLAAGLVAVRIGIRLGRPR